jgi:hypothetical protein
MSSFPIQDFHTGELVNSTTLVQDTDGDNFPNVWFDRIDLESSQNPNTVLPTSIDYNRDGQPDLFRNTDSPSPHWTLSTSDNSQIAVEITNLHYDTISRTWIPDSVTSQDGTIFTFNNQTNNWDASSTITSVDTTITNSSQYSESDLTTLIAERDSAGRPVNFLDQNNQPHELIYGPKGGPIGLVQDIFARGHSSWTGNDVGRAGQEWGIRLADLVQNHSGTTPVVLPGESIESMLERYNVPQEEAAVFLASLHTAANH